MNLKTTHFGIFVIFAAIYAAGTLGIESTLGGEIVVQVSSQPARIKPGELASPLVALFGVPSIFGLVLGQFIANLASEFGLIDLYTPAFSLIGLIVIRYATKIPVIARSLIYVVITSGWIGFIIFSRRALPLLDSFTAAFVGQLIAIIIGYLLLLVLSRTKIFGGL